MKKLIIFLLFVLATCSLKAQDQVVVAGDNVCLRAQPNERSKLTGPRAYHFNNGDRLDCYGQTGNYYKVMVGGGFYYIPKKYARPRAGYAYSDGRNLRESYYHGAITVAGDNVCLRSTPSERGKLTGPSYPHFFTGDELTCVGQTGSYYKVVYNGSYYYIPKKYGRPRY